MIKINKTSGNNSPIILGDNNTIITNPDSSGTAIENPSNILVFEGGDTLTLSKIMLSLSKDGIHESDCSILIEGFDNHFHEEVIISGANGSGIIDGYIRSLVFENKENNQLIDVGGSNATSERIAAKKINLILTTDAYVHLTDSVAHYYDSQLKTMMNCSDLYKSFKLNQITNTVAIAKQLKDEKSLYLMLKILNFKNYKPSIAALITESFRVFEMLFCKNIEISILALGDLKRFINRSITDKDFSDAVIYAIESMGYIVKCHKTLHDDVTQFLLDMLSSDKFFDLHREDIIWCSLVTLKNKVYEKNDLIRLEEIFQSVDGDHAKFFHINSIANHILYENGH